MAKLPLQIMAAAEFGQVAENLALTPETLAEFLCESFARRRPSKITMVALAPHRP